MPIPRLDDANIEFEFTQQESLVARALDSMKIAWLQTKYANYWKLRNSIKAPESPEEDRSYFLKVAELDGKLGFIQELLDDHKNAISEMSAVQDDSKDAGKTEEATAKRAALLVHRIQTQ